MISSYSCFFPREQKINNSGTKRTSFLALIFRRGLLVKDYPWQKYVSVYIVETNFILFSETVPLQLCRSYTADVLVVPLLDSVYSSVWDFCFLLRSGKRKKFYPLVKLLVVLVGNKCIFYCLFPSFTCIYYLSSQVILQLPLL